MQDEARLFCSLIESAGATPKQEFASALQTSLANLVAVASRLPSVSATDQDLPDRPSHEQWMDRFAAIQQALDDWGSYWTTPEGTDGFSAAPEQVNLTLADDPADIWRDLKPGLLGLDAGAPREDVI
jgi:hypothetical protein